MFQSFLLAEIFALRKSGQRRGLRDRVPQFRHLLEESDRALKTHNFQFLNALDASTRDWNKQRATSVVFLLFGFHLAMVGLWRTFGVTFAEVASFSMGEANGAHCAGAVPRLSDACALAALQGVAHDWADGSGSMLVVIGVPRGALVGADGVCATCRCEIGAEIADELVRQVIC